MQLDWRENGTQVISAVVRIVISIMTGKRKKKKQRCAKEFGDGYNITGKGQKGFNHVSLDI